MVPNGWQISRLEEIAKITDGAHKTPRYTTSGVPFLRVTDIKGNYIDLSSVKFISDEEHLQLIKRCKPEPGDILYSKNGTIGIPCLINWNWEFSIFVSLALIKLTNKNLSLPEYIVYVLASDFIKEQIRLRVKTGTVTNLHLEEIKEFQIPLPPSSEQKKIVEILSSVDEAIASTQAVIDQTRKLKQGLLQQLLTRGIGHTQFKESAIGQIPATWEVVAIGDVADVIDPQPDHRTPPEVAEGIPYIGMGDIRADGSINFDGARKVAPAVLEKQRSSFTVYPEAFIFGKIGTIGNPAVLPIQIDFALSANLILITSKDLVVSKYLLIAVQSPLIEQQIELQTNITSQPALGIKKVRKFFIPFPPRKELESLVDTFQSLEYSIKSYSKQLQHLEQMKRGLMQDLLTGRVRVKNTKLI